MSRSSFERMDLTALNHSENLEGADFCDCHRRIEAQHFNLHLAFGTKCAKRFLSVSHDKDFMRFGRDQIFLCF